jgi:hypothetical protein
LIDRDGNVRLKKGEFTHAKPAAGSCPQLSLVGKRSVEPYPARGAMTGSTSRPKPNNRVTKGKLRGRHFAFWAKGEAKTLEFSGQ